MEHQREAMLLFRTKTMWKHACAASSHQPFGGRCVDVMHSWIGRYVETSTIFNYFILICILINCVFIVLSNPPVEAE